jgi:hypothetical protein
MAWARAKEEIPKYLEAPETAEFPDKGEIKKFGWGGHSVVTFVDARDSAGAPVQHQFEVQLALNDEQDGLMVWIVKRDGETVYHNPRVGLGPPMNAADAQRHAEEVHDRRAAGEWIEVAEFEGKDLTRTKWVTIKERGFKMTWAAFADVHVDIQNRFGVSILHVGDEHPTSTASIMVDLEPGEYCFLVYCRGPWVLGIDE